MSSPMMKQWEAVKSAHPDGLVFFRMGDFFEFFHEDAKTAARLLGLTLTARSKGEDAIPMAGIPFKSANGYINRLIRMGEKVVICDQVEDPAEATGIVDRQVTRIVTPGTVTEDEALEDGDNNFLLALDRDETSGSLAWVDVSTGEFRTRQVSCERLVEEAQRLDAAECLVRESFAWQDSRGRDLAHVLGCPVTRRPDWSFDEDSARRNLSRHFGTKSLAGFGFDGDDGRLGSAGAVLEYLEETQRGAIGQIRALRPWRGGDTMALDRATRASLELVGTVRDRDRRGSLLGVMDRTVTAMGARLLKGRLLAPLVDAERIRRRHAGVAELVEEPDRLVELRRTLGGILDFERLAARVGCGRVGPRDLAGLRQSVALLPGLRTALDGLAAEVLREAQAAIPDLDDLAAELERALVDDPPLTMKDGGLIREGYHAELDELRALGREGKDFIASFQARETERTGIASLKIGFNRVFGYYIEVTNTHREKVPETWVRKQTLKNAERYITPELKEYEDKVLNADERVKRIELELFGALRESVLARLDELQAAARAVARIDVLQSLARLARDDGWVQPEIAEDGEFRIEEGRHPVLVRLHPDEPFVPNDVDLDDARRMMLITGPNMAGKSTYIRQVALLALMAQVGSFVPARRARIPVFDRVFTRVGASDDLAAGNSTFMVEMLEVANILNNATERSLVILDEVGRGTSTYDGLSLAWAITEHLARKTRSMTLFATHYHELTEIADAMPAVVNFNVAVREWGEEIIFLHKIVPGGADKSYGLHVARLAGLPPAVTERARRILDDLEQERGAPRTTAPAATSGAVQLALFDDPPDFLRERLEATDVNGLTPLAALNLLAELRALL